MRLLKLLAYSLLGYVLYELYLGMTEGTEARLSQSSQGRSGGSSQGRTVDVQDSGGEKTKRNVGRGVVH